MLCFCFLLFSLFLSQTNIWTGDTGEAEFKKTQQTESWDEEPWEPCRYTAYVSFWFPVCLFFYKKLHMLKLLNYYFTILKVFFCCCPQLSTGNEDHYLVLISRKYKILTFLYIFLPQGEWMEVGRDQRQLHSLHFSSWDPPSTVGVWKIQW